MFEPVHHAAQESVPVACNDAYTVNAGQTLRFDSAPDAAVRSAVDAAAAASGGTVQWRDDAVTGRTYALVQAGTDEVEPGAATLYPRPIIALAVRPNPPEALPTLLDTFGGEGRPTGIAACTRIGEEMCLEWFPDVTSAALVRALLRTEVGRFAGWYVARSLAPLPDSVVTSVAAHGLQTPEIAPDRVLDFLVAQAYGRP